MYTYNVIIIRPWGSFVSHCDNPNGHHPQLGSFVIPNDSTPSRTSSFPDVADVTSRPYRHALRLVTRQTACGAEVLDLDTSCPPPYNPTPSLSLPHTNSSSTEERLTSPGNTAGAVLSTKYLFHYMLNLLCLFS